MDSQTGIRRWFASDGKRKMLILRDTSSSGGISSISAVPPITALTVTGATVISTSISSGVLVGRYSGGSGIMEEITIGSGLSLSGGGVLTATGGSGSYDVFYVNLTQVSPNDYTGTASNFTAYSVNAVYFFVFDIVPSGVNAIRVNLNSTSYITIVKPAGGNLPATAITLTTAPYEFAYNGTNFVPESRVKITGEGDALSSITAAIATNSIDSSNYAQTWAWSTASTQTPFTWTANALSTGTLFTLSSTSTAGDESKLLQLTRSGANAGSGKKNYGLYSAITNTGTTSTNVAGYFSASGATNNYGLLVAAGSVGIGTTTPTVLTEIQKNSIGTTRTDAVLISNTTAATNGAQQYSPSLNLEGFGWGGSSQVVNYAIQVIPVQATTNPFAYLNILSSINSGAYSNLFRLSDDGGLVVGVNGSVTADPYKYVNVIGNGNTSTSTRTGGGNHITFIFGFNNTSNQGSGASSAAAYTVGDSNTTNNTSLTTITIGNSNTNNNSGIIVGTSNSNPTGGAIVGNSNSMTASLANWVFGTSNSGNGSWLIGSGNTGNANYSWPFAIGFGNTVYDNGISPSSNGGYIIGISNTISSAYGVMGQIFVQGSGITMASNNLNSGTFNYGWNTGTGNRPSWQLRTNSVNLDAQTSIFNQVWHGIDVTATGVDPIASNVYVLKEATTLASTGSISSAATSGGNALFTVSATITGIATGERVTCTFSGSYTNGDYYYIRVSSTTFFLSDTRAHALAGTNKVAFIATCTGTVTPVQRLTEQMAADTVVYYANSITAGQSSPHWITEDLGTFVIATGRVGWRTNTNLILATNDTTRLTLAAANMTLIDPYDLVLGTSTGTKFGTATNQKLGFWNTAPIIQPTTGIAASTFVANTSGIVDDSATWDSYTIGQVVKALRNVGLLA